MTNRVSISFRRKIILCELKNYYRKILWIRKTRCNREPLIDLLTLITNLIMHSMNAGTKVSLLQNVFRMQRHLCVLCVLCPNIEEKPNWHFDVFRMLRHLCVVCPNAKRSQIDILAIRTHWVSTTTPTMRGSERWMTLHQK
jgi:hypothetical protein